MAMILVTGLTGNVGSMVAAALKNRNASIVCGVRDIQKSSGIYGSTYDLVQLDFLNPQTFDKALDGIDRVFLNYPPETPLKDFHSFIRKAKDKGVRHISYLSIKGAQYLPFVPHFKNEKAIIQTQIPFTFLRAGYFTQNLNMFLLDELVNNDRIFVPAGKGRTSFIDLRDIADAAAVSLMEEDKHKDKKYILVGNESLDFFEVAEIMTRILGRKIIYSNPSLREFKTYMLEKGLEPKYVNVVAGLHTFTKIGLANGRKSDLVRLTGKLPLTVEQYVADYREVWKKQGDQTNDRLIE